jgi:SAM-dependent methyltransferase
MTLYPLDNCRVCGSRLELIEELAKIPLDGSKFSNTVCDPEFYDSALYLCPECGLYQMPDIKDFSDFYDFSNTKYIKSLNAERKKTFEEFLQVSTGRENILGIEDVGFKQTVDEYYKNSFIIDPAILCKEGAGKESHFVLERCSSAWAGKEAGENRFDAAYVICPLAHMDNPLQVMRDIYTVLREGGAGWIEVLNGGTLVEKRYYYNFMPILLNYWTLHSLSVLLRLSGLETVMIQPGLGGDQLNVFFKKPLKRSSLMARRDEQINSILNAALKYKQIVVWGAGAKAHYLFGYLSDKLCVSHIVDGSPSKKGLFMPGAKVPVESPAPEIFASTDLVIIFAASYEKEITQTLREQYNYTGRIFCLSEN